MGTEKPASAPPALAVRAVQGLHTGLTHLANRMLPPEVQLLQLGSAVMKVFAMHTAVKLGLPDKVAAGPRDSDDLARELDAHPDAMFRLLRALSSIGIFRQLNERRFGETPMSRVLRSDLPDSIQPFALLIGDPIWARSWLALDHSIRNGESAFEHVFGKGYFEYLEEHPDDAGTFNEWMSRISKLSAPAVAGAYDFSKAHKVVDVGGGQGVLISDILLRHPGLKGVVFDLPSVVEDVTLPESLSERLEVVGGDFFEAVPEGGDIYVMQQIIHDWDDEACVTILRNCAEAMAPEGRVLVVDAVIEPGNADDINKFIDLHMLVIAGGGKERTLDEFRELLATAGLRLLRRIRTAGMFDIVEAEKAETNGT
jgi:hypothetical protein